MNDDIQVKICGLREQSHIHAAVAAGAQYIGFMFFEPSPRNLSLSQATELVSHVPAGVAKVAVTVNAGDAELEQIVASLGLDMLQLHGSESPDRVAEIRARFGVPVMKVVGVRDEGDLPALDDYGQVADQLLVETKPPKDAVLPGGNGIAFDWRLVAGRRWPVPWMLAGGLTAGNVAEAVRLTGARQVDVSSGVETAPGVKDAGKIQAFLQAAQSE
ncbi:MAG: phosphoribosylanthranilate isomerase [Paracoccaceae bacterium]